MQTDYYMTVRPNKSLQPRRGRALCSDAWFTFTGPAWPSFTFANLKISLVVFLAIACISSVSNAAAEKPAPDAAVVKVLDKPLPSEEGKQHNFLWSSFANKPDEQKFNSYTTEKWKQTFEAFAAALVKKAGDQNLNSISLRKALDLVLKDSKDKIAYLPVGAYQTTLDGKPVWILTVKWEYPSMGEKGKSVALGHIRAFVFDQKTLKQVGFMTCS